ncbi:alkaline phosphatase family protein [Halococcus dombrowskii]|uniref:Alkaline phosphatase family protein n=1 Tax=Halococcus dombrowskii TaxID=179637 RepID=A0AAV3SBC0_HALDO|nr:alkaline phosphatase family protein [Halococcus dombrowskii]UOO94448.1 alkaline phosphatase family protein [Halococcus dombrowskii]
MNEGDARRRALVLGLDGVPWERLRAWAAAGELPNFAALIDEGAAGPLASTQPANTALAWPSIATGVRPDKHGIYAFYKLGTNYRHRVNTGEDVSQPALWELVSPSTVVNMPMTYPASSIDGRMVTGMMTPDRDEGFTHPPELAATIADRVPDYEIGLDWNEYRDRPEEFPDALASLVAARRELMNDFLADDWRLFFFVYTAPDRLQHLLWDEEILLDHYKQLDAVLGDARETAADTDANLFVVSDHGFGPIEKNVHVNRVLADAGYLTPKSDTGTRSTLSRIGLTKERVLDTLDRFDIDVDELATRLPDALVDRLATGIPGENVRYDVEYDKTTAFVHAQGTLYVNDTERFEQGIVPPGRVDALKAELTDTFTRVRDPDTDERVLAVHDGDELFPTDDAAPDLVIEPREGYYVKPSLSETVFSNPGSHAADHRPEGIFLAEGPDIAADATPTDASVFDVAPTVLHSMGAAVPTTVDGRVLDELFAPDSSAAERSIETVDITGSDSESRSDDRTDGEDFSDVEERLRGLGYVE